MKREIPLAIVFISGLVMMIQYYCPRYDFVGDMFQQWFAIIQVFAYVLGIWSVLHANGSKILKGAPGWFYNVVLLAGFFAMLLLGIFQGTKEGTAFDWLFNWVYNPLSSTMFALLAFFIASAAFRAFKAKTVEATLLLGTAFIVMIGRVPVGELIWNSLHLNQLLVPMDELIDKWIMGCFTTAGQRAIMLGATVGLISMSLKLMLGIERSYLGGE